MMNGMMLSLNPIITIKKPNNMQEKINWERIENEEESFSIYRAAIPGGWLILIQSDVMDNSPNHGFTTGFQWRYNTVFIPDPYHKYWDIRDWYQINAAHTK